MMTSFYSGLTGLSAYANALNIVGNNLANINTVGFKGSTISFSDLVTATFGGTATNAAGNPMQVGLGVLPAAIEGVFTQGSIQTSSESTNMAIEGNGYFIVGNDSTDRFYTRSGNFSFDRDGYLITQEGKYVFGYTQKDVDGNIISSGALNPIYTPANTVSPPSATTFVRLFANLNVNDAVTPAAGSTFAASVTLYDSKGSSHTATITFTHNGLVGGNDQWAYNMTLPGEDVVGGTAGTPYTISTGTVEFDGSGTMVVPAADIPVGPTPAFTNGADAMSFNWDLFDDNGVPTLTGYPTTSATSSTSTDGNAPGTLTSIIVGDDGTIQGVFSNGQVESIAMVATAVFNNNRGLLRVGGNEFSETYSSGEAAVGAPGSGGRGAITGSALEASNVDIATEFTNMLVFQRGYQANSRIITTSDEVIQEALSIKR